MAKVTIKGRINAVKTSLVIYRDEELISKFPLDQEEACLAKADSLTGEVSVVEENLQYLVGATKYFKGNKELSLPAELLVDAGDNSYNPSVRLPASSGNFAVGDSVVITCEFSDLRDEIDGEGDFTGVFRAHAAKVVVVAKSRTLADYMS